MAEVLLSYSHDSPDHKKRVLNLADRLCGQGVDAHLDQYEHPPPPNWPRWMMDEVEMAKTVLVVCTETYDRRFRGHEEPGKGKGVVWEGVIITQELYEAQCKTTKFIPVIFHAEDEQYIPVILRGGAHYLVSTDDGYEGLYRVLTNQPAVPKPDLGERVKLPPKRATTHSGAPTAVARARPNNLPFPPNPHFTGRDELLVDLRRKLAEKPAAITQPQAVHGLGGVGKTQLAVEYAWKHQADYDAVLWVVADSPENAAANLAALCRSDVLNLSEAEAKEQAVQVDAVRRWLREHNRWLLVFDSVDTREAAERVRQLLDPAWSGQVVITSRRTDWHQQANFSELPVNVLTEPTAAEFLQERTANHGFDPGSDADARALAHELGCLPLALEQAAAYILHHRITFADYLALLKKSRKELLEQGTEGGTRYPKSVAETWLVSEQQLSLEARAVLRLAAFLAPDDIPRGLFAADSKTLLEAIRALASEQKKGKRGSSKSPDIEAALVELADHSLITLTPKAFSCHRLVQAVQGDRLTDELRRRWIELALRLINGFAQFEPKDVRTWPVWDVLRAHAEMIVGHADRVGISVSASGSGQRPSTWCKTDSKNSFRQNSCGCGYRLRNHSGIVCLKSSTSKNAPMPKRLWRPAMSANPNKNFLRFSSDQP